MVHPLTALERMKSHKPALSVSIILVVLIVVCLRYVMTVWF
jgi:hypothetical protein